MIPVSHEYKKIGQVTGQPGKMLLSAKGQIDNLIDNQKKKNCNKYAVDLKKFQAITYRIARPFPSALMTPSPVTLNGTQVNNEQQSRSGTSNPVAGPLLPARRSNSIVPCGQLALVGRVAPFDHPRSYSSHSTCLIPAIG